MSEPSNEQVDRCVEILQQVRAICRNYDARDVIGALSVYFEETCWRLSDEVGFPQDKFESCIRQTLTTIARQLVGSLN